MRILFWSQSFLPQVGGVEVLAVPLISALQDRGHEVLVVTSTIQDGPAALGPASDGDLCIRRFPFDFVLIRRDPAEILSLRREVAQLANGFRPDLVHIFHPGTGIFFHPNEAAAPRTPTLITLHSGFSDQELSSESVRGRVLRSADWVTTCSEDVLTRVVRQVPEIGTRASVVWNGLPMPPLVPRQPPYDPPRLLCISRLVWDKGIDLALNAFSRVLVRSPRARLTIAGDGPLMAWLQAQARELGIDDAVSFLGLVPPAQIPTLIDDSTLLIIPSRSESFGLAALQAGQMARPVVATRVGGLAEVVVHERTGLLVDSQDADALSQAILSLLDHPDTAEEMGRAARKRAVEVLTWARFVDAYDSLYRRLAN